jgi:ribonuclease HI
MILTESVSTMMAVSDRKRFKNPKTQLIRKLRHQESTKVTLLWVCSHVGIPGKVAADDAAKEALNTLKDTFYRT